MKNLAMNHVVMNNLLIKKIVLLLATLAVAPFAQADFYGSNLWQTPDQRGDALLRQGKATEAAQTYTDARHKAYAELKAGLYANAAHDLAPFNDSDALYNRGNALAHTGDLESAIKAYDAALARNPKNKDAQHNRDLAAQALKKQQEKKQQQQKNSSKSDSKKQNQGNQGNQGKSMQNSPANGQQKNDANQKGHGQQSDPTHQKQNDNAQPNGANSTNQHEQNQKTANNPNSNAPDPKPTSGNSASANPPAKAQTPQERAAAAQRDAEAGLKSAPVKGQNDQGQAQQSQSSLNPASVKSEKSARNTIQNERTLAEQQWLKSIPDNPEGLLQRKFLIEHLMRQHAQQTQP